MFLIDSFKNTSLTLFLERIEENGLTWIVKRLSGNDTGLNGSHQVGVYYPKDFFDKAFPEIRTTERENPDTSISVCYFPNDDTVIRDLRVIYYNNKFFGGTRNEFRITRWGGKNSPTNDVENTGSTFIFAVGREENKIVSFGWVAASLEEENLIENWLGEEVEPGAFNMVNSYFVQTPQKIPSSWFDAYPSGREIFEYIVQRIPGGSREESVDKLLLRRRELEFLIYRQIEENSVLPIIRKGFDSVDDFIRYAHSVSNRRKSRTGTSLELNLEMIFRDEKLYFETQVMTENRNKPDFLFPSAAAYHDPAFLENNLRMVAAKTTCKDRWRQITEEASRIKIKHLFTLQQGISENQLKQMTASRVQLIVPQPHLSSFPKSWKDRILTLEQFMTMTRQQQTGIENLNQWIV